MRVRASGALQVKCQRCLAPVQLPVEVDSRLTVVASETEIREVASPYDTVVAGPGGLVLGTILEDEILTSLPMATVHDECTVSGEAETHSSPDASRPLAGLGALLRQE
ncbi:MAG: YceD family protein [Gammaproteobacteria bacterium]|nr:YceD family protein [Gammaproteobacteria bacterium]